MTQSAGKPLTKPPVSRRVRIFIALALGVLWAVIFWQLTARNFSWMGWSSATICNTYWKGYPAWLQVNETSTFDTGTLIASTWSLHGWNMLVALAVAAAPVVLAFCIGLAAFRRLRLQRSTWWFLIIGLVLGMSLTMLRGAEWPQSRLFMQYGWIVDTTRQEILCETAVIIDGLFVLALAVNPLMRWNANRRARLAALAQNHDWTHETPGTWDEGGKE